MTLLDRYQRAARLSLPNARQRDIITELGEHLQSKRDERKRALGRAPDEVEQKPHEPTLC